MQHALEMGAMLASSQTPVLIFGETGTGKELFARFIHKLSSRSRATFLAINCAAIPEDLVESLLFGHKKGVFTGAITPIRFAQHYLLYHWFVVLDLQDPV